MDYKGNLVMSNIDNTTQGLRTMLFEEITKVRNGESTPQRAKAVSSLVKEIVSTTKLDMEYRRFVGELPATNSKAIGSDLTLQLG